MINQVLRRISLSNAFSADAIMVSHIRNNRNSFRFIHDSMHDSYKGKSVIPVEMAEQFLSESISVKMEIELFFNMGCDSIFLLICQEEKLTD